MLRREFMASSVILMIPALDTETMEDVQIEPINPLSRSFTGPMEFELDVDPPEGSVAIDIQMEVEYQGDDEWGAAAPVIERGSETLFDEDRIRSLQSGESETIRTGHIGESCSPLTFRVDAQHDGRYRVDIAGVALVESG